jgi:restriction system protein
MLFRNNFAGYIELLQFKKVHIMWVIVIFLSVGIAYWWWEFIYLPGLNKQLDATYESIGRRVATLAEEHGDALARKRRQGIYTDDYGRQVNDLWIRDFRYFYDNVICSDFTFNQLNGLSLELQARVGKPIRDEDRWLNLIFNIADEVVSAIPITKTDTISTGQEYEFFCATVLEDANWSVRRTGGSGDQGVDLIAEHDGVRVVIQCKFYSSPVGNAAVQEIIAGKTFEGAAYAAVVSNSTYTSAARQLASTSGVFLLHHDQLPHLADLLATAS